MENFESDLRSLDDFDNSIAFDNLGGHENLDGFENSGVFEIGRRQDWADLSLWSLENVLEDVVGDLDGLDSVESNFGSDLDNLGHLGSGLEGLGN